MAHYCCCLLLILSQFHKPKPATLHYLGNYIFSYVFVSPYKHSVCTNFRVASREYELWNMAIYGCIRNLFSFVVKTNFTPNRKANVKPRAECGNVKMELRLTWVESDHWTGVILCQFCGFTPSFFHYCLWSTSNQNLHHITRPTSEMAHHYCIMSKWNSFQ